MFYVLKRILAVIPVLGIVAVIVFAPRGLLGLLQRFGGKGGEHD